MVIEFSLLFIFDAKTLKIKKISNVVMTSTNNTFFFCKGGIVLPLREKDVMRQTKPIKMYRMSP